MCLMLPMFVPESVGIGGEDDNRRDGDADWIRAVMGAREVCQDGRASSRLGGVTY